MKNKKLPYPAGSFIQPRLAFGYHSSLLYLSTSLPSPDIKVSSSPCIEIFPTTISGGKPWRLISNRTFPLSWKVYVPLTAIPWLSTALNLPSFQNTTVAVFPTSRHFPTTSGVFTHDIIKKQVKIASNQ